MSRRIFSALLALGLGATPALAAETYDLIFKTGTLDGISEDRSLTYDREVVVHSAPDYATRNTGEIRLTFEPDEMARLRFYREDKYANVGAFPATVGNPVIMYFIETVLRDVAAEAGGSPFYIRNRIKEALVEPAPIEDVTVTIDGAEIAAQQITLRPFEDDENRDRMQGYGDLALTFTMSEDVPGWYASLSAEASGEGGTIYSNALRYQPEMAE